MKPTDANEASEPVVEAGQSKHTQSIWLGLAQRELTQRGTLRIRLKWGRIATLMASLLVFAWLGKSVALYYFFSEVRGFEEVRFADMLPYPLNRGAIRVQQGDYQVAQGMEAIEREDYRRAFGLLREGVARSPQNLEGRLTLAQLYAGWRPELSIDLLTEGLEYALEDADYVQLLTALLLREKEDARLLELTEELIPQVPEAIAQTLAAARLSVAISRGQFDIAESVFRDTDIKNSMDGILLGSDLYMQLGQHNKAKGLLRSVIASFPDANLNAVYRRLINIHRQLEEYSDARQLALDMLIAEPENWRSRILLVDILNDSGMEQRRDREIESILRQHRNDPQAMTALGQIAANQGNARTALRLYELALENDYDLGIFSLILIEAHVNDHQFQKAIDLSTELVRENPPWLSNLESTFNGIRSIAYFGVGNTEMGNLYLNNFLQSRQTTVSQLFQAALSYQKFDLFDGSLALLREAHVRDASDEKVLAQLVDLQMRLGLSQNLDDLLTSLFALRRPEYTLIESIQERLRSDRFLFTQNRAELLTQLEAIANESQGIEIEIWQPAQPNSPASDEAAETPA